jgi:hypothetical protein
VRLVTIASHSGVAVRLLGGTAIQLISRDAGIELFAREPQDIDLVCPRGIGRTAEELLDRCGYRADDTFNALNGHRRLLFFDDAHDRQVDVFVGEFTMCHSIPIARRLDLEPRTLPCAELLLMKLQIVELNAKDQTDILALLLSAEVTDHDRQAINGRYVAELCAMDWGLWRTVTMNVERTRAAAQHLGLSPEVTGVIDDRVTRLEAMLHEAPKPRKWRMRAKVGDRVRWYEEPEEVS